MKIKKIIPAFKTAFLISIVMIVLCGFVYPLVLTGVSMVFFKDQANGSLIEVDGKYVGSSLVGQDFTDNRFMKARPSAVNYNTYTQEEKDSGEYAGVATGSDNYAPSNPDLKARVEADLEQFLKDNPTAKKGDIPGDILTASGSGLDPHISVASAEIQIPRLMESTNLSEKELLDIIKKNTSSKVLGIFGEETVNVLMVNLDIAKKIGII